jgi:quinol monooxygenase YgiN
MSVIMTMQVKADPARMEEYVASNGELLTEVAETGKRHGVIAHRFYTNGDTIMVLDEWPDEQSFQAFFQEEGERIQGVIQAVGGQGEPDVSFWTKIDSPDEIGWGA